MEHSSSTHSHPEVVWGVWLEPGPVKVRASCVALVRSTSKRDKKGQNRTTSYMSVVIGDGGANKCVYEGVWVIVNWGKGMGG